MIIILCRIMCSERQTISTPTIFEFAKKNKKQKNPKKQTICDGFSSSIIGVIILMECQLRTSVKKAR